MFRKGRKKAICGRTRVWCVMFKGLAASLCVCVRAPGTAVTVLRAERLKPPDKGEECVVR